MREGRGGKEEEREGRVEWEERLGGREDLYFAVLIRDNHKN